MAYRPGIVTCTLVGMIWEYNQIACPVHSYVCNGGNILLSITSVGVINTYVSNFCFCIAITAMSRKNGAWPWFVTYKHNNVQLYERNVEMKCVGERNMVNSWDVWKRVSRTNDMLNVLHYRYRVVSRADQKSTVEYTTSVGDKFSSSDVCIRVVVYGWRQLHQ